MIKDRITQGNIYEHLPPATYQEQFEDIHKSKGIRIERIVSIGQATP